MGDAAAGLRHGTGTADVSSGLFLVRRGYGVSRLLRRRQIYPIRLAGAAAADGRGFRLAGIGGGRGGAPFGTKTARRSQIRMGRQRRRLRRSAGCQPDYRSSAFFLIEPTLFFVPNAVQMSARL